MIVAVCDSDLVGKKIEEGKKQLDLSSSFYDGEEKNEEEILNIIDNSYMINAVGEKSISLLDKFGLVDKERVLRVNNIPHAQVILE